MPEYRDVIPGTQVSVSQPSVAGLQAAMAAGTLSSADLTGFYRQRIERLNPALHAVITVNPDAQAEAAASDAARAADGPRGPLEGIPVLVKDNVQVAGMPTTAGSPALLNAEPGDAFLVGPLALLLHHGYQRRKDFRQVTEGGQVNCVGRDSFIV